MRRPIVQLKTERPRGEHPGLLLQRFLCEKATGKQGNPQEKRELLDAAIKASQNPDLLALYQHAFSRWRDVHKQIAHTVTVELQTAGRLIVGLGSENVLETGITLNHVFGLPVIPGSGLKGLASHYCDQVWGGRANGQDGPVSRRFRNSRQLNRQEVEPQGDYHRLLFGSTDDSGCIIFHDAWFVPGSDPQPLRLDVMTPHHLDWLDGSVPPSDFDSPNPVPFLSVSGRFLFALSWNGPRNDPHALTWTKQALKLVTQALCFWGIGGKTSSGYGRFVLPSPSAKSQPQPPVAVAQQPASESATPQSLSPLDQKVQDFLAKHPNKAEKRQWLKLAQELKNPKGIFQDAEERISVAKKVQAMMEAERVWNKQDKDANMTAFIWQILEKPQGDASTS